MLSPIFSVFIVQTTWIGLARKQQYHLHKALTVFQICSTLDAEWMWVPQKFSWNEGEKREGCSDSSSSYCTPPVSTPTYSMYGTLQTKILPQIREGMDLKNTVGQCHNCKTIKLESFFFWFQKTSWKESVIKTAISTKYCFQWYGKLCQGKTFCQKCSIFLYP